MSKAVKLGPELPYMNIWNYAKIGYFQLASPVARQVRDVLRESVDTLVYRENVK